MAKKLNAKQRRFVDEYLLDLNATRAAIRAGYSAKTAGAIGHELLKKPEIADAIAEAMKGRASRTQITADRVLLELSRIAFFDIRKLYRPDGSMRAPHELDDDAAAVLSGVDVIEQQTVAVDGDGEMQAAPTFTKKSKVFDKVAAIGLAMKHLGLIKPADVNVRFPDGVPSMTVEFVDVPHKPQDKPNE